MAVKRVGIMLPGLGIHGGINIVLNWAVILAKSGYHIDIILPPSACRPRIPFLSEDDSRLLHLISEFDARRHHYHAAIATLWATIAVMAELKADHHAWFMQAYEAQFLELNSPAQADFDELAASLMNVIAIAPWLQQHILRHYNFEPKQTFCVLNALDKTLWKPVPREPPRRGGRPVRFLVEGPVNDPRKNVAQTVRLLEGLGVPYMWVGSSVDRTLVGPNCFGVEQQVPYHQMPRVYGSADVLVKASNSEGMFGPPLEMFATGGTAAAWQVQGAEEYMSDRYNSYLVPMNSWPRLTKAILELADSPDRVRVLQENALATAEAWPTWEDQADQIVTTIESLVPFGRSSLVRQVAKNQYRGILQTQTLADYSRAASAEADRAERAEAQLAELTGSRAMRLVRAIQRGRRIVAPDHSWRWVYIQRAGRLVWRAGRRIKRLAAAGRLPSLAR
ncbi:MAG TPA: glycosyltransferase [Isosphaeraceae bacterium]|nr:glycosyltransferase [Isosphaeraceae bacterium]